MSDLVTTLLVLSALGGVFALFVGYFIALFWVMSRFLK